ncbi:MAG: hypothetical protein MRZ90_03000 [Candidatus Gastranaerophilales bacterium]|nr:hypothetical protein [Candidatus Gastranaerophilales bacterium]
MSQMAAIQAQITEARNKIVQYTREKNNWNSELTLLQQNAASIFYQGGGQDATIYQNQMSNYLAQQESIFNQQIAKCDTMLARWNQVKSDFEGQANNISD